MECREGERGGRGTIEGTITSPTEGEFKESVTCFYLSFVQRNSFMLCGASRLGTVTLELRDGPLSVVRCVVCIRTRYVLLHSGVPRGAEFGGGSTPPHPPKFRRPSKIVPKSIRLWKLLKVPEFRTPTPQDVRKKSSKILKLPPVRNCFTLAMTNKLVVIIDSLKVPTIKKMLLYEMKFLVRNYSCLQNP